MSERQAPLEVVLHVPKCAGSTIEAHLETHLGAPAFWSAPKRSRNVPLELLRRKYANPPAGGTEPILAISGHYIGQSVLKHFPGRRPIRSVLLREPKALVLSWYNFRMMRYVSQGLAPYPFALHLRSLPPDPLCHFLLAHWLERSWLDMARMRPAEKLARLEAAFDGFDFVGDIAECDRLVAQISDRLGIPGEATRTNTGEGWRAETGWEPLRLDALTGEERSLLERRTQLDACLYGRLIRQETAPLDVRIVAPFVASELRRPAAEIARRRRRGAVPRDAAGTAATGSPPTA